MITRFIISLISLVNVISCFVIVKQLSLNQEPTMEDYDTYLDEYVGNSEKLVVLLDYDGTLAPIMPHPNLTYMTDYTKEALVNISSNPNVFISVISGRAVDDVKKKVGIENIVNLRNHFWICCSGLIFKGNFGTSKKGVTCMVVTPINEESDL